jgi:hypothetical protein
MKSSFHLKLFFILKTNNHLPRVSHAAYQPNYIYSPQTPTNDYH